MLFWWYCRFLWLYWWIFAPTVLILCFRIFMTMDGPFVTQSISPIHPIPLFFTKLCSAVSRFCHLAGVLSPLLYVVLYPLYFQYSSFFSDFVLPFPFLIFPNHSLTTNATACNRLLQSVMLEVVMY